MLYATLSEEASDHRRSLSHERVIQVEKTNQLSEHNWRLFWRSLKKVLEMQYIHEPRHLPIILIVRKIHSRILIEFKQEFSEKN